MKKIDSKNKNIIFILLGIFLCIVSLLIYKKVEEKKMESEVIINLEGDEIDKYNVMDIKYLGYEVLTLDNEETIKFTFKYKNTSNKTIGIEPKIVIASDLHGGRYYYDDKYEVRLRDREESFVKGKGIDIKEFKENYYKLYQDEYLDYINIFLEPNEEVEVTFTQKKSDIINNLSSNENAEKIDNLSIKEIMNLEYMNFEYGYKYKLEENQKYVEINYSKYPNSDWNVYGYIE